MKITRRNALGKIGVFARSAPFLGLVNPFRKRENILDENDLKGRIKHSICKWPYGNISLEELCRAATEIGLKSIELLGPEDWPILKKYGLTCAMP